jgi:TPR repeat protein
LQTIHGKNDFTAKEYSDARDRILDSMAADIALNSTTQPPGLRQGDFWIGEGKGISLPQPHYAYSLAKEAPHGASLPSLCALQEFDVPEPASQVPRSLQSPPQKFLKRRSASIFAAASFAAVATILLVGIFLTARFPADPNSLGPHVAIISPRPETSDDLRMLNLDSKVVRREGLPPYSAEPGVARPPDVQDPTAELLTPPPPAAAQRAPIEALRSGTQALRAGKTDQAVTSLEYAAEQGLPGAMWKLGRMYADGDGVGQNKMRAFEYFRNLAKTHTHEPPDSPDAPFVASAFVALGQYYLDGIPDNVVKPNPAAAIDLFRHAASRFGDPDAQYHLGRLYLLGTGTAKDTVQAARWLRLAANKGQRSAQALLGDMLLKGQGVARQPAMGLAWLSLAKEGASSQEAWIVEMYRRALAKASIDERVQAGRFAEELSRARRAGSDEPARLPSARALAPR